MIINETALNANQLLDVLEEHGAISLFEKPKTHAGINAVRMFAALREDMNPAYNKPISIIIDETLGEPERDADGMTIMGSVFADTNGNMFLRVAAKAWADDRFRFGIMPKSWMALRSATVEHAKTALICFGEDRHKARHLLADAFELTVLSTELEVIDDETMPKHLPSGIVVVVQDGSDEQALEAIASIVERDTIHDVIVLTERSIARFKDEMAAIDRHNTDRITSEVEATIATKH